MPGVSEGGARMSAYAAVVCATLNKDIDDKIEHDLQRLAKTTTTDRLIYCCSKKLTEYQLDGLTSMIRKYLPASCNVTLLGNLQLSELAERHQGVLAAYYKAEIDTIEANLLSFRKGHEPAETKGLRLALITLGSDDARTLRKALSDRAVIEVLGRFRHCDGVGDCTRNSRRTFAFR